MFAFGKKEGGNGEPQLTKKKRIFQEEIRRKEKDKTIGLLRQKALLPENIAKCLKDLPGSLPLLISFIEGREPLLPGCHLAIAEKLSEVCSDPQSFLNQSNKPNLQVGLVLYIMTHKRLSTEEFQSLWTIILNNSDGWPREQCWMLLKILATAVDQIDVKYLKGARLLLDKKQLRFDSKSLDFYDFVVKRYPREGYQAQVLSDKLFTKIIEHMKICFYTSSEKIQMVELLVQILYKNEAETVACNWDLPRLFDILEFFLGSDSKLLIERSLLLIFNLNIDRGSTIFLIHPCVEQVVAEMQNEDLPLKLRELMAQTYLGALANLSQEKLPKYIGSHTEMVESTLAYIMEEMGESQTIMMNLEQVMKMMLQFKEGPHFLFRNWLATHPVLLEAVRNTPFGASLLSHSPL